MKDRLSDLCIFKNCIHRDIIETYAWTHGYLLEIIDLDGYERNLKIFHKDRSLIFEELSVFFPMKLITDRLTHYVKIEDKQGKKTITITIYTIDRFICKLE